MIRQKLSGETLAPLTTATTVRPARPAGALEHGREGQGPGAFDRPAVALASEGHAAGDHGLGDDLDRVDEFAAEREGDGTGLDRAGDRVGDRLPFVDLDETARGERRGHESRGLGLDADDPEARPDGLEIGRDPGDETAAPDRHEDLVEGPQVRVELEPDRAGPVDDVPVVVGRDEDASRAAGEFAGDGLGLVAARPPDLDVDAQGLDPLLLDLGDGLGEKELEPDAFELRGVADGQAVVPRRGRDDPSGPVLAARASAAC